MEENLTEINRIIVFGEEGTGKSNLLNKLSLNDNLFKINKQEDYKEINKDKDFISKKVIIEDTNFELYDTIGISPTFPISNIKEKVSNFKEEIMGKGFKGIFITFSVYKVPINFDSFELIILLLVKIIKIIELSLLKEIILIQLKKKKKNIQL